jgi:hypothetical protein
VDEATARLATALGAAYRLRAADAVHLATAVMRVPIVHHQQRGRLPEDDHAGRRHLSG